MKRVELSCWKRAECWTMRWRNGPSGTSCMSSLDKSCLVLREDADLAMQHLNEALKYGRPNARAVALLVKLLAQQGDIKQAHEKMELIPAAARGLLLGRVEAAILLSSGDQEAAYESAQAEAERHPENASTLSWFAGIAERSEHLDEAATAYRQASELSPLDHNIWTKLVAAHARQKDIVKMEAALRDAQLALDPEYLPLLQAKFFELQGRWKSAEGIYLNLYQGRLTDPAAAQRMAAFYLLWTLSDKDAAQKAAPYINRVLRAAYEGQAEVR